QCECLFFFSSRRRHTRSTRDWSSDVCSSDLKAHAAGYGALGREVRLEVGALVAERAVAGGVRLAERVGGEARELAPHRPGRLGRSEERRGGKDVRQRT